MMLTQISDQLLSALNFSWRALNSSFGTALIGGLAGAFAGALGAQHIAVRSKRREDFLKELRNTNAATMVSFSTCNAALALKKQHVQPMYAKFVHERAALNTHQQQRATGQKQGNVQYRFIADMRVFPAPVTLVETLKDLVFHQVSAYGRSLALVAVLEQSLVGLAEAIAKRDVFIHRISSGAIPAALLPQHYFGMPLPGGDINQEYRNRPAIPPLIPLKE